ncbi:MAG: alpha/beta hydrolase [Alphaproteobacteria bacterium]|nr:alpha/beta hydrolase [Alphaproteobacteria bacterium]
MPLCTTRSGTLHFTHNGVKAGGPQLLLIHGAGGEVRCWPATWRLAGDAARTIGLAISADLSRITNHSIYALDLPGHGRSPGPARDDIEALADCVEDFIEAMGIEDVVPVGHSMGGAIALTLGRRDSPHLAGLIIVASAAKIGVTDDILNGLKADFARTIDFIVKYSFDREAAPFFPGKAREYALATGPRASHADFLACSRFDMRAEVPEIKRPVLVIAAENDRMIPPKHTAALAAALPNARLVSIPDSGHYPQFERTTAVEAAIVAFCAALSTDRA